MKIKKYLQKQKKIYELYRQNENHIKSLKFNAKRKLEQGLITPEKYAQRMEKIEIKKQKLKSIRNEF